MYTIPEDVLSHTPEGTATMPETEPKPLLPVPRTVWNRSP
jgi:hypothetical protein